MERVMSEPLGLASKTVRVVPYDDRWPALFRDEATRLAAAISAAALPALIIEHVGSTAVPGLAAKPILDIALGHSDDSAVTSYIPVLETAGYVYRGDGGLPGREFFRRGVVRTHHLHLVALDGSHWQRYLVFRDALRTDVALRNAYAALKLDLAVKFARDREAYIDGKATFVEAVVRDFGRTRGERLP